jgi:hypothetical protein
MAAATPHAAAHPDAAHGVERRRPLWPWITLGVVLVLLVVAFIAVDAFARGVARDEIGSRVTSALGLPAGTPVEVEVGGGPVLFQLAAGRLDSVDITVEDATFGRLTGDLEVHAEGIPLDASAPTSLIEVRYAMPESEVAEFREELSGLPLDSITLDDPEIVTSTSFRLFGIPVSVGMGLEPSAEAGQLIFTPTTIIVQDQEFSADSLRSAPGFGQLATVLLQQQPVCIAQELPAALVLERISVEGDELVAHFSAQDAALGDFGTKGACA